MNKICDCSFDLLISATDALQNAIRRACNAYHQDVEKARQYKDEDTLVGAAKAKARQSINDAMAQWRDDMKKHIPTLRKELCQTVKTPPNKDFTEMLGIFKDYGINPGKVQIEALLDMNNGNLTGLQLLNNLLQKSKSVYRIRFKDVSEYEKDIDAIGRMTQTAIPPIPQDAPQGSYDILVGTPIQTFEGCRIAPGTTIDQVQLLFESKVFNGEFEGLKEMRESWTQSVTYDSIEAISLDAETTGNSPQSNADVAIEERLSPSDMSGYFPSAPLAESLSPYML